MDDLLRTTICQIWKIFVVQNRIKKEIGRFPSLPTQAATGPDFRCDLKRKIITSMITPSEMKGQIIYPYIYSMVLGGLGVKSYRTLITEGISAMILL